MTRLETSPGQNSQNPTNELQQRVDIAAAAVLGHVTFSDPALRQIAEQLQVTTIKTLKDEFTSKFAAMRAALAQLPDTEAECNSYLQALGALQAVEASLQASRGPKLPLVQ